MKTRPMLSKYTSQILLGLMVGAGALFAVVPNPAVAQVNRTDPLEDLRTKDGSDFFNGRGNGQNSSMMNFIQNAIIGTPRNIDEFVADQKENMDDVTTQFRKQQADLIRKRQPQAAPIAPVELPASPSN